MMKNQKTILLLVLSFISAATFTACKEDDSESEAKGNARVEVTDAAVDAANITGVFLSVEEIQARSETDVRTVARFDSPKTFNLMDYQNGSTYALGEGEITAGVYDEIRFILDGSSYVEFEDGSTKSLTIPSGSTSGYKISGDFEVTANGETDLVADIDLRKALVVEGDENYKLRPTARVVEAESTGTIKGSLSSNDADRLVVYAYAKGTFSENETSEPAEGSTRFEGSVNSAVVSNNSFTLAFMEEGEYDLVVAAYNYDETSEEFQFRTAAEADVLLNGNLLNVVRVEANSSTTLLLNLNF